MLHRMRKEYYHVPVKKSPSTWPASQNLASSGVPAQATPVKAGETQGPLSQFLRSVLMARVMPPKARMVVMKMGMYILKDWKAQGAKKYNRWGKCLREKRSKGRSSLRTEWTKGGRIRRDWIKEWTGP